ncbi:FUSC family protein [Dictyobacter arantiisoli]|uniref:Integral membrane bound transporter domain-containing protein n=1 Tax=Dictyobacter arantiisoli TaxID=2014874 RepID=A0A5A5TJB1_9CHLR|nr:FUSC family protein [Dictyobacter arantiisoli]GCF11325.1 hypothetical protein KDI_48890 [Dictyobacter arantiisoli]
MTIIDHGARKKGGKNAKTESKPTRLLSPSHFYQGNVKYKMQKMWRTRLPFILFALKGALASGLSWEIAFRLLGKEAAALAPVSAIIIVQITSWQTTRKSIERILGVLIGASLSILVTHFVGINFWTIVFLIVLANSIGLVVQKRGQYLATQIPISALLAIIMGTNVLGYPMLRLLGAVIGGGMGVLVSVLLSPPVYVNRARESVAELSSEIARALPGLADAVAGRLNEQESKDVYTGIRAIEQNVRATESALSLGFDDTRFNPWGKRALRTLTDYPEMLLSLNRIVRQLRRIAFTINEPTPSWQAVSQKQHWIQEYSQLILNIGTILALTADHMLTLSNSQMAGKNKDIPINIQRAEDMLKLLEVTQRQLQESEAKMIRFSETNKMQAVYNDESENIREGYRLSIQGSIYTDLRRILNELYDVLTALPIPSTAEEATTQSGK